MLDYEIIFASNHDNNIWGFLTLGEYIHTSDVIHKVYYIFSNDCDDNLKLICYSGNYEYLLNQMYSKIAIGYKEIYKHGLKIIWPGFEELLVSQLMFKILSK